jgi:hypothetical protein
MHPPDDVDLVAALALLPSRRSLPMRRSCPSLPTRRSCWKHSRLPIRHRRSSRPRKGTPGARVR